MFLWNDVLGCQAHDGLTPQEFSWRQGNLVTRTTVAPPVSGHVRAEDCFLQHPASKSADVGDTFAVLYIAFQN